MQRTASLWSKGPQGLVSILKKIRLSQVWGSSSLITSHAGTCHPGLFRSLCGTTDAQETATNADVPQEDVYVQG